MGFLFPYGGSVTEIIYFHTNIIHKQLNYDWLPGYE